MNVPLLIAKKYFLSKKKRGFINFISLISMLGLCVGTASLIIILSVFNGLEDLNRQIFKAIDPDLKISSSKHKSFDLDNSLINKITKIEGIDFVTQVYQDKALARSKDAQMIVEIKGVDSTFERNVRLKSSIIEGQMELENDARPNAFVGNGVFSVLDLQVDDFMNPLTLLYPKNEKLNVLSPENNVNQFVVEVSGAFSLEQQYDNYVYLPLWVVEKLTERPNKRTSYEISCKKNVDIENIKTQVQRLLNKSNLQVKNRDEQNSALLRAIKIEKLFIFIALIFIIGIASFNIFYALSMLVIDKKDDINTLNAIGASNKLIEKVFLYEGLIIAFSGMFLGLILGLFVCFIQMKFGIVKLGMQFAVVDAYPVKLMWSDILFSIIGIFLITILVSIIPAKKSNSMLIFR